jgi:HK97 family phage portal protein
MAYTASVPPTPSPRPWLARLWTSLRSYRIGPHGIKTAEDAKWWGQYGWGPAASSGISVSEHTAMNFSAVWAAVSIIAGDVASLPLILYKRLPNGGKERFLSHKLYRILHDEPNPEMGSMVFRETLQAHLLTWGNGYAEIERDGADQVSALWPLTPDRVYPFRQDRRLKYRVLNPDGGPDAIFEARDIFHVPGLGFDGVSGYSVIAKARESVGLGLATERFGGAFFGKGSTFGGVLSHPKVLSDNAKKSLRESIETQHQGVERAHKFLILEEGMAYERLGIPPNDAQFLETRKFQITEIARWFQLPPHKLADLERATFSNIEQQDIEYYKSCLRRWLVRWEQELNRKLIARPERNLQFAEHLVEGLLRGDSQARGEYYSKMFTIGAFSVNKILELENQNPIPGGDARFIQGAMVPLSKVEELAQSQIDKNRQPKGAPRPAPEPVPDRSAEIAELERTLEVERRTQDAAEQRAQAAREAAESLEAMLGAERAALAAAIAAKTQAEESVSRLTEALAQTSGVQSERDQLATALDEAHAQRTAAESAAQLLTDQVTASEARHAEAAAEATRVTHERDAALAAVVEAQAELVTVRAERRATTEAERDRLTRVVASHRALVVDAMGRMTRREAEKARRHQATPEKLRRWLASFDALHEDLCVEALRPAVQAHLAWMGSTDDPEATTRAAVKAHLAEFARRMGAVLELDGDEYHQALAQVLARWESDRPQAVADAMLQEAVTYVSNYGR